MEGVSPDHQIVKPTILASYCTDIFFIKLIDDTQEFIWQDFSDMRYDGWGNFGIICLGNAAGYTADGIAIPA